MQGDESDDRLGNARELCNLKSEIPWTYSILPDLCNNARVCGCHRRGPRKIDSGIIEGQGLVLGRGDIFAFFGEYTSTMSKD
jgi:hypothetical protein